MKNPIRKITALLMALVMVLTMMPISALASIITVRQTNVIIDVSKAVQVAGDLVTSKVTSRDGYSVVVTSPDKILPNKGEVLFKNETRKSVAVVSPDVEDNGTKELGRFDISIVDAAGNEWQPKDGETVDVAVRLGENGLQMTEGAELFLIHYGKNGKTEEVPAVFYTDKDIVKGFDFTADGFSVYAVVESSAQDDPDARLYVHFMQGTSEIAAMSITQNQVDAGQMNTNIYDPHFELQDGEVFKGWIQGTEQSGTYTVADAEDPNKKLDIDGVRSVARQAVLAGVQDGDDIYFYAMIFNAYHVSYYDELGVTIFTDEVLYLNGDTEIPYTIQFTYTPYYVTGSDENDETKAANFDGWGRVVGENIDHVYQNGDEVNMASFNLPDSDRNLTLLAQVAYGHWLVFNENGSGASYTAPLFVATDKTPATAGMPTAPTRTGYDFGGWYTNEECTDDAVFDPTQSITQTENVYAKWTAKGSSSFTVLIWEENLGGGYDFVRSITIDPATTGSDMASVLAFTNNDSMIKIGNENVFIPFPEGTKYNNENYSGQICEGFKYKEYTTNNEGKVAANGSSVLNVYFERRTYTLKFYYGAKTSNGEWRIAHNNNNSEHTWGAPSGFTPNYTGPLTKGTDRTGDGKVSGGTYYYAAITAKYGADISGSWPGYDVFSMGNSGQNYLNSWILMPGAKARTGRYGGNVTVKGKITLMDEQLIGDLSSETGYVVAQYNNSPNYYTYYIYFKDANGDKTYNGKKYSFKEPVDVHSGSDYANQHAPSYKGYNNIGSENNGVTTSTGREIYYYYDPISYPILFMDGQYEDGSHNPIANKSTYSIRSLQDEDAVEYNADVSEYNSYNPVSEIADGSRYVFMGWYSDDQCTTPYTFTTMEEGGITVYAKWMLKEYKVNLNPNEDGDTSFKYINEKGVGEYGTYGDTFYVNNGENIGNVGGKRDTYDLIGWFANEGLTKVWDFDAFKLNDTIVRRYGILYALDGTDSRYNPEYPATVGEINLYASWRKILDGADGINVVYTATGIDDDNQPVIGTDAPSDPNLYSDKAKAIARPAAKAPVAGEGETQLAFQYWVVQKWNEDDQVFEDTTQKVFPGDRYTVRYEDAQVSDIVYEEDDPTKIKSAVYTVQLRAHYSTSEEARPTHIYWYNNYQNGEAAFIRKDEPLAINENVNIPAAPSREGYIFLGWAEKAETDSSNQLIYQYSGLTSSDLFLTYDSGRYTYNGKTVTAVFADESLPYKGMYAVWAKAELTVTKTANQMSGLGVNDEVTYTVVVENTGDVNVTGITLSDSLVTLSRTNATQFDLTPGENREIAYTYNVTQADVDAGSINNTVTATGKDPNGEDVTDDATATVTTVEAAAELTVTKTADKTSGVAVGEEITYTVTVENTGNVTVKDIALPSRSSLLVTW